jgi:signal transduction histidine kinase/CheY-like chemotaxis protein
MTVLRRSLVALGIAAMLPTVVFAAFTVSHMLRLERERVSDAARAQSQVIMTLADTQLQRHFASLDVLASSLYFESEDWAQFYWRVQRLLAASRLWESIVLIDVQRHEQIFDLSRPFGAPIPVPARHQDALQRLVTRGTHVVGDVEGREHPVVWLYVAVRNADQVTHSIAASLKLRVFQDLLNAHTVPGSSAAIVDGRSNFVARTLDYPEPAGALAMQYMRDSTLAVSSGLYVTTDAGLKKYTAYEISPLSGWSTHLAVASASIDAPTRWSFVAAGIAALAALALGAFLVMLVLRDTAERRRAEEMLRQSQKMEAIGQLTGGIAHDFNNLLTAIIGNLDLMRTRVAGNERLQRLADNALEAARKGAQLASQLLAFSRSQRLKVQSVDLAQLLNGMSGLLSQSVGPGIRVDLRIDEDARYAISDTNQLELALLNLAVNARDAMPGGGTLTIRARLVADGGKLPQVELSVADTGSGMTEDVRSRAIEPFFTTKPTGVGTGLGLSQVYGVVRESGGTLAIDSEPGRGTTVRLILQAGRPPAVRTDEGAELPPTVPGALPHDPVRVLIVDDDRLVRRLMSDGLRSLQYQVTACASGEQALATLDAGERFDLLLVDFAMPGMNGADVVRAVQDRQPDIKVLMVSGYADSTAVEAALGNARLLRKPFDVAELGAAVAETLADVR